MSTTERRQKVVKSHPRLSLTKQCDVLEIHRSSLYYKPKMESSLNLKLMKIIDKRFLVHPYYGIARMTDYLRLDLGYKVNVKRIRRLYRIMNLRTIYARPKTTKHSKSHEKHPYLLKKLEINRPNQVWQTDITYIPMHKGFMYMIAYIDVFSRKILNWSVSNSMSAQWCAETLQATIDKYGCPEIHNSDQGSQFTSDIYLGLLKKNDIKISMDGKGRATDNIYIERFWRSLKQEKIYLNPPNGGLDLYEKIVEYIKFYNSERRHTEIGKITPNDKFKELKIAS